MLSNNSGRKHTRVPFSRMVGINFNDYQRNYPIEDLSLAGLFVAGQFNQQPGTPCTVTLTERWSEELFSMNFAGIVTRHEVDGIAIEFAEMTHEAYELLQTILLYSCEDPLEFGEEFANDCPFTIAESGMEAAL